MAKYRKKPVVIDARRLDGTPSDVSQLAAWCGGTVGMETAKDGRSLVPHIIIPTLEGYLRADAGDMIIRGVGGEFCPCKSDIFAATYDVAGEADAEPTVIPQAHGLASSFGVLLSWILEDDAVPAHIRRSAEELERRYFAPGEPTEGERQADAALKALDTRNPLEVDPGEYDMMALNVMLRLSPDPRRPDCHDVVARIAAFVRMQDLSEGADAIATRWREADMDTSSRSGSNR